jgi:hypothetical protein
MEALPSGRAASRSSMSKTMTSDSLRRRTLNLLRARARRLGPGLSAGEIAALEARAGVPYSESFRGLIREVGWYETASVGQVWLAPNSDQPSLAVWEDELFPRAFAIALNYCGAPWFLTFDGLTGEEGAVLLDVPDLGGVYTHFESIDDFVSATLEANGDKIGRIESQIPYKRQWPLLGMDFDAAMTYGDEAVREMAKKCGKGGRVFDLGRPHAFLPLDYIQETGRTCIRDPHAPIFGYFKGAD